MGEYSECATFSNVQLAAERRTLEGQIAAHRKAAQALKEAKEILDLEFFRRKNAKKIAQIVYSIRTTPGGIESIKSLRSSYVARIVGPTQEGPYFLAWKIITGRTEIGANTKGNVNMITLILMEFANEAN